MELATIPASLRKKLSISLIHPLFNRPQKIDQAVAVFLYEKATGFGFPYRPSTPVSTEEHNFDSTI
ncbi:hypothetical protein RvY_13728 [Ramazzottius varieornatus]|uniref:Uncharacterized protein n=1 Tax=Ramazzottius varieornatus TaxID=947166 RepID=A0A1D1VQQ4_RAMVA|nr:hypothetical protein RvY_13728 [Ramazzottius varieornatus]